MRLKGIDPWGGGMRCFQFFLLMHAARSVQLLVEALGRELHCARFCAVCSTASIERPEVRRRAAPSWLLYLGCRVSTDHTQHTQLYSSEQRSGQRALAMSSGETALAMPFACLPSCLVRSPKALPRRYQMVPVVGGRGS